MHGASEQAQPQPNVLVAANVPGFSARFWLLLVLTGVGAGLAAGLLMKLLRLVQHAAWSYPGGDFLDAVANAAAATRVEILAATGGLVGLALYALGRVKSAHSNELEATIWFRSGALAPIRTALKAVISIIIVALGASLGREAAPKQAGALIGSLLATWRDLPTSQHRLLAACGAGAGIAAVYDVPFGGALFLLEVLIGTISLPLVTPAFAATLIATATAWLLLPNEPTYQLPVMPLSAGLVAWSLVFAPVAGVASALFVKLIALVAAYRPKGLAIIPVAVVVFAGLGALAIPFPQLLGNGRGVVELAALDRLAVPLMLALVLLKPLVTAACLGTGAPGGLFTPTMAFGALLGGVCGHLWMLAWPAAAPGAFAVIGAGAVLAATTKGPISSLVMMMELTNQIETLMLPMMIAIAGAVGVAHLIDRRSTYTSRLKPIGSLRDCVYKAGLAPRGAPVVAVSSAERYEAMLALCLQRTESGPIYVVDDGGAVSGTIEPRNIVSPAPRFMPLEIAVAIDFVEAGTSPADYSP